MSRYPITVRFGLATDHDATIGYDPPMRTYFLQGFEDPETENLSLWMGTRLEEFPTLSALLDAARAAGFMTEDVSPEIVGAMAREERAPHRSSLVDRAGWPIR